MTITPVLIAAACDALLHKWLMYVLFVFGATLRHACLLSTMVQINRQFLRVSEQSVHVLENGAMIL